MDSIRTRLAVLSLLTLGVGCAGEEQFSRTPTCAKGWTWIEEYGACKEQEGWYLVTCKPGRRRVLGYCATNEVHAEQVAHRWFRETVDPGRIPTCTYDFSYRCECIEGIAFNPMGTIPPGDWHKLMCDPPTILMGRPDSGVPMMTP